MDWRDNIVSRLYFVGLIALMSSLAVEARAQVYGSRMYRYRPVCVDGQCPVKPATFGFYETEWRRWPTSKIGGAQQTPFQRDLLEHVDPLQTPDIEEEADITSSGSHRDGGKADQPVVKPLDETFPPVLPSDEGPAGVPSTVPPMEQPSEMIPGAEPDLGNVPAIPSADEVIGSVSNQLLEQLNAETPDPVETPNPVSPRTSPREEKPDVVQTSAQQEVAAKNETSTRRVNPLRR